MAVYIHKKGIGRELVRRIGDKAGDTQQYKGYELRESSGGVFFAYKNGKVISGISGDLQDVKHTIDYIMGDRSDRPGDSRDGSARARDDNEDYKGWYLESRQGSKIWKAYKNGREVAQAPSVQELKKKLDELSKPAADAKLLVHVHTADGRHLTRVIDCGGVMDCGCGGAQARDAAYHTCQECEANFTAAQCANGKLPDHKFLGKPCPGSGAPVQAPASKARDAGAIVVGTDPENKVWYYTGRAGEFFVSRNKADAFTGYNIEGARRVASTLNNGSKIHGIRFMGVEDAGEVRIVYNKLLGGWYIVRGPAQTPLGGKFATKEEAEAHLNRSRDTVAA